MAAGLDDLLNKEMTRKQFLLSIGLSILTLLGFSNLLDLFGKGVHDQKSPGYGKGIYTGDQELPPRQSY